MNSNEDIIMSKALEEFFKDSKIPKSILDKTLDSIKKTKVNILIVGATGAGKSSTINALFDNPVAKVGNKEPETKEIERYEVNGNLILWDSPGLGESSDADEKHIENIRAKLNELDHNQDPLIDLVLFLIDGSSRDLGSTFKLLNEVIIPSLHNETDRLIVAVNQADMAMKGHYWDKENSEPEPMLIEFLNEKIQSIKNRIKEETNIIVNPIYYSAGIDDKEINVYQKPYNLSKLLDLILDHIKSKKRAVFFEKINKNKENFKKADSKSNYNEKIDEKINASWFDQFIEIAKKVGVEALDYLTSKEGIEKIKIFGEIIFSKYFKK